MRLVNLLEWTRPVAQVYANVPQPMAVYHSTEEFEANVQNAVRITTFGQFHDYALNNGISLIYNSVTRYVDVQRHNIWIKTVDRFRTDTADNYGNISYQKDANGQPIPTDGCWIQLFFITPTPARIILYTSSGVNTTGLTKWQPTAAIRPTFIQEAVPDKTKNSVTYDAKLQSLLTRRKPNVAFTRLAMALFASDSESFLDIEKSTKLVFGHNVRSTDREKLLTSPAFKEALMTTIKTLFPSLAPAIRKQHDPDKLAGMLQTIWDLAAGSKDVDKMLKVFDKIADVGYAENGMISSAPMLPVPPQRLEAFPDPNLLSENIAKDDIADTKQEEEIATLKAELDYPESFIMQDKEGEENV